MVHVVSTIKSLHAWRMEGVQKCIQKNFPKQLHETIVDENYFVVYKRPNNQRFVIKGGIRLDNHWIVPHNIELLKNMMPTLTLTGATKASLSNSFLSM
jgi:hypothetical protein